jgi:hypothetical protein
MIATSQQAVFSAPFITQLISDEKYAANRKALKNKITL